MNKNQTRVNIWLVPPGNNPLSGTRCVFKYEESVPSCPLSDLMVAGAAENVWIKRLHRKHIKKDLKWNRYRCSLGGEQEPEEAGWTIRKQ